MDKQATRERILEAATDLIAENGYKETTTKDIATKAGVSEMSVFRHFGSKKAILEAVNSRYTFNYPIEHGLKPKIQWDLDKDIYLFAKVQYEHNLKNEKAILIRFKESKKLIEYGIDVKDDPRQMKAFFKWYFDEMYKKGKLIKADNELLAVHFMGMNFGIFCNKMMDVYGAVSEISKEDEIRFGAACFAKSLKP